MLGMSGGDAGMVRALVVGVVWLGALVVFAVGAPIGVSTAPAVSSAPFRFFSPTGFEGKSSAQLLAMFPWNHLQLLKMELHDVS